jgi:hypothetical protein
MLEAELHGSESFCWYDPAIFTRAVAQAMEGAMLVKESFDNIIAFKPTTFHLTRILIGSMSATPLCTSRPSTMRL